MIRKFVKPLCIILFISLFAELFIFNFDTWCSLLGNKPASQHFTSSLGENDLVPGSKYYLVPKDRNVSLELKFESTPLDYLYLDMDCIDEKGNAVPCVITVSVADEGNTYYYKLPSATVMTNIKETQYMRPYCYGDVIRMVININPDSTDDAYLKVNDIVFNANVPMFFSAIRFGGLFVMLLLIWLLRPSSSVYSAKLNSSRENVITYGVIAINIIFFLILIFFNTGFYKPGWIHHQQYHKLAVALTEGRVNIVTGFEDVVSTLTNPYDTELRRSMMESGFWNVWDMAYFEGKFYVYFGIVPVLIFYLPYYLLTGKAFPTNAGIFLMSCMVLLGVFYLMKQITRRYFKKTPFALRTTLTVIIANSIGTIPILMRPDFYSLPIICALAFTIWGLGIWFRAAYLWKNRLIATSNELDSSSTQSPHSNTGIIIRLLVGSLFMALTAGCRPQFLVGSFLIFFIFNKCIRQSFSQGKNGIRHLIPKVITVAIPYIIVAAGIMYYNYIRFGSPFDFGANYNLTTNDMTNRGFNLGRLTDGIWMYLFQLPNIGMKFPYVFSTSFSSEYMGSTIREAMYGGAFFTQLILLALPFIIKVKKTLKEKGLWGYCLTCIVFAFVIVVADSEMAGILSRYYYDFLWLLLIPAAIVIMQLWEQFSSTQVRRGIITFVTICFFTCIFMNLAIGFQASNIGAYNDMIYNYIKNLLS